MPAPSSSSVLPESVEPGTGQLRVSDRVLNVFVAKVELDGPGVLALVGQLVTGGVPEHMGMDLEIKPCFRAGSGNDLLDVADRQWTFPLGYEHKLGIRVVLTEFPQCSDLPAPERVI